MALLQSVALRDALAQRAGLLLGLNLALALALLALGRRGQAREGRAFKGWRGALLLAILGTGLVIRAVYLPLGQHVFDGHEADYFDAFRQRPLPEAMGYRFYPAMAALYRGLGAVLGGGEGALLGISLAVGILTLYLSGIFLSRLSGRASVGLAGAALLAIDPLHAFWSSSAYNVMLPFACLLAGGIWMEEGVARSRGATFGAGLLMVALAFSLRMESLMVLLPLGVLCLMGLRGWAGVGRLSGGALPGACFIGLHALALGLMVPRPAGADSPFAYARLYLGLQWDYLGILRPYDAPLLMGVALAGLALALTRGPRGRRFALVLLAGWIPLHLIYAGFDDYGTRHTLWMRLAPVGGLAYLLAYLQGRFPRLTPATAAATALILLATVGPDLTDTQARYYATPQDFLEDEPAFETAPYLIVEPMAPRCIFVSESSFYSAYRTASHFELLDPPRFRALQEAGEGCVLYVYDLENHQLSSRSIRERALKVRRFMDLELMGKRLRPDLEDYALIYKVKGPRGRGEGEVD